MKIGLRFKILGGFLVIILLLLIVFLTNLIFQNQNAQILSSITQTVKNLSLVQDLDYYGRSADDSGSFYLLSQSSTAKQDAMAKYNNDVTTVNKDISLLKQGLSTSKENAYLQQFQQNWNAYLSQNQQAFTLYQQGKKVSAQNNYVQASFDPVIQPLLSLTTIEKQKNSARQEAMASFRAYSSMVGLIIVIISLLIGLIMAWVLSSRITKSILAIRDAAKKVADGDLSIERLQPKSKDEVADLVQSINDMVDNLRQLIHQMAEMAQQVAASSQELSASADETTKATNQIAVSIQQVAQGAEQQKLSSRESATAMEEISNGIQHIAERSSDISQSSQDANRLADEGQQSIENAERQMESIKQSVDNTSNQIQQLEAYSLHIGQIIETIKGIAEQTNLLSLNAAIEAARAGEHGKGFAVVAEEVRKLAEESANSAKEITKLVEEIQANTQKSVISMRKVTEETMNGVGVIQQAGDSFGKILTATKSLSAQVEEVTAASEQISATTQEVTASIEGMSQISGQSSDEAQNVAASSEEQLATMQEITASADALSKLAQSLRQAISRFNL